uniref:peroxidase n=1 Tax=Cannabis sativa TaxID=3483 RepID=A0A803P902_CANSA
MDFQALLILIVLFIISSFVIVESTELSLAYYRKTCPEFEKIIHDNIESKQLLHPLNAPATLRLFFHDCMVEGCDASILISPNQAKDTERDADINHSLVSDAFDVVASAKTTLEKSCPGIVSCADILAQTTRDLVTMVGGPFYKISPSLVPSSSFTMNPPDHNELTDEPSNPSNCSGINEELRERENQIQRGQCKARKRNFKEGLGLGS